MTLACCTVSATAAARFIQVHAPSCCSNSPHPCYRPLTTTSRTCWADRRAGQTTLTCRIRWCAMHLLLAVALSASLFEARDSWACRSQLLYHTAEMVTHELLVLVNCWALASVAVEPTGRDGGRVERFHEEVTEPPCLLTREVGTQTPFLALSLATRCIDLQQDMRQHVSGTGETLRCAPHVLYMLDSIVCVACLGAILICFRVYKSLAQTPQLHYHCWRQRRTVSVHCLTVESQVRRMPLIIFGSQVMLAVFHPARGSKRASSHCSGAMCAHTSVLDDGRSVLATYEGGGRAPVLHENRVFVPGQ